MSKALVDKHLKNFEIGQRQILNDLREMIAAELPTVFPYSGSTHLMLAKELAGYEQTKGSIHFALDKRFPKPLLKKIIKARISWRGHARRII